MVLLTSQEAETIGIDLTSPCGFCGEGIRSFPIVFWATPEAESDLLLHIACSQLLGLSLIGDSREAFLAEGAEEKWKRRAERLFLRSLARDAT